MGSGLRLAGLDDPVRRDDLDGDNWPITWAGDDRQYAAYGDGWGCRPVERHTKLNTGMVRLSGNPPGFCGEEQPMPWFGGGAQDPNLKGCGLLAVDGVLYHFLRLQVDVPGRAQRRQLASGLIWSRDLGGTWEGMTYAAEARDLQLFFEEPDHAFHSPTFLQAGQDYALAQDGFVYLYSPREDERRRNDHLDLARVPRDRVTERGAYEFFAGMEGNDRASWTRDVGARVPVLRFPGHIAPGDVVFHSPSGRYLLLTCQSWESVKEAPSQLAFFDAPHPWGPWTQVGYVSAWGSGRDGDCRYDPRLPVKWIAPDGMSCILVYSDRTRSDVLNYQGVRFTSAGTEAR
ncbi:MAG TPA: DUF4185 domain-containing protein [Chloroflexota bacterium]|nr:DUF4185 domain-containing protein [Chloroflexota bacterium]